MDTEKNKSEWLIASRVALSVDMWGERYLNDGDFVRRRINRICLLDAHGRVYPSGYHALLPVRTWRPARLTTAPPPQGDRGYHAKLSRYQDLIDAPFMMMVCSKPSLKQGALDSTDVRGSTCWNMLNAKG